MITGDAELNNEKKVTDSVTRGISQESLEAGDVTRLMMMALQMSQYSTAQYSTVQMSPTLNVTMTMPCSQLEV